MSFFKKLTGVAVTFSSLFMTLAPAAYSAETSVTQSIQTQKESTLPAWWKEAVFYQIYPRSFKDTNGDGIGDIRGIIEKLDYLRSLGIDAIWINPHYDSPNTDNGYDIRDYEKIMQEYGTMEDFDTLVSEMKKRNMRLMIDVVINHTSDQHPWFIQSKSSKENPYREYYFWRDGKDNQPPNNYPSFFGGSAWQKDDKTGQYYLHYFARQQPDLNWDNPKVRGDLYAMLRFWLDKGVSGMRFDTVATYSKIPGFPDLTPEQQKNFAEQYTTGPNIHRYLQEMKQEVLSRYDVVTAGEIFGVPLERSSDFFDRRRNELDMSFMFDLIRLDRDSNERWRHKKWTLSQFRQIINKMDSNAGEYGWNTFFLDNHDNPRAVSHFGDDSPQWIEPSAKALATIILTQRATPFIFQGSELGMTNYPFKKLNEFDDIEVKGFWQDYVQTGKVSAEEFIDNVRLTSRDNSRTPFQWNDRKNAGFTSGKPWFRINPNYVEINADKELIRNDSVLNYYKEMIKLRHKTPALIYGTYKDISPEDDSVYAYTRTLGKERYLVVINFTEKTVRYPLPENNVIKSILIEANQNKTAEKQSTVLTLSPWQAGVYELQ
ncbi:alpha-glucosidase [Kosakonia cowanii]|uniref:glycoside hydrolase family 13 protein n=1 Tax=Kosakonia cowanii TaxID=208223 RepID=UPI001121019A|nr:alpha-glucosidase [Kosakonia cowanii]MDP9771110.1 oligo-1,6-glucosidase [Atlantibacter hermannii]TPD59698.1 alpha-glucosidase [Kosakonia cowanii]TPD83364.1 alpha-glucosidase [Kosakonia cowanii]TPE00685.1 alpha-glucosidase [Kosakonia cowanii]